MSVKPLGCIQTYTCCMSITFQENWKKKSTKVTGVSFDELCITKSLQVYLAPRSRNTARTPEALFSHGLHNQSTTHRRKPESQLLIAQVHMVHVCSPCKWNHLCLAYFAQHYACKTLKPSLGTPTFLSVLTVYWWLSSFLHLSSPETCNSVKQTLYSNKYLLSIQTMPGIVLGMNPKVCCQTETSVSTRHLDQRVLGWAEDSHWYVTANFERNLLHALKTTPSCSLAHG